MVFENDQKSQLIAVILDNRLGTTWQDILKLQKYAVRCT